MLELKNICKRFGGVTAVSDVSLEFLSGSIHGIVGENGAGKSTLMNVIAGSCVPDKGVVVFNERVLERGRAGRATSAIAVVHQEIQVLPQATIAENILFGRLGEYCRCGAIQWPRVYEAAAVYMEMVGLTLSPEQAIGGLSAAQKQLAQIAKALAAGARVLLLDEPTSSLTEYESGKLLTILRRLRAEGRMIIFISHKLEEVLAVCDRVSVLRDGRCVATHSAQGVSKEMLVGLMMDHGGKWKRCGQLPVNSQNVVLEAAGLRRRGRVEASSFRLYEGEILGFYGLVGSGRTELARLLVGADRADDGRVRIRGKEVTIRSAADALHRHGLAYVTENRKEEGLLLEWDVGMNLTIGVWRRFVKRFTRRIDPVLEEDAIHHAMVSLKMPGFRANQRTSELSGGNQQRVSIGKWLAADCDILILDEPTVGVDVGAKEQLHQLIRALVVQGGKTVILISSDISEIIGLANRVLVFKDHRIAGEVRDVDDAESSYEGISTAIGGLLG